MYIDTNTDRFTPLRCACGVIKASHILPMLSEEIREESWSVDSNTLHFSIFISFLNESNIIDRCGDGKYVMKYSLVDMYMHSYHWVQ